jgi:hypothetical protein
MATVAVHGVTDSIKHKTSKSLSVTLATPLFKISILTPDTEQTGSCHNPGPAEALRAQLAIGRHPSAWER